MINNTRQPHFKNILKIIILVFLCGVVNGSKAQHNRYDEIKALLKKTSAENTDSVIFLKTQLLNYLTGREHIEEKINTLIDLSESSIRKGAIPEAAEYCSNATLLAESINNKPLIIDCYYCKSRNFLYQKKFAEALSILQKGVKIAEEINAHHKKASALSQMGFLYAQKNMIDSSLYYQNIALEIKVRLKDSLGIATSYSNIGYLYYLKGQPKITREYFYMAAKMRSTSKDPYLKASSLIDCASAEQELGDPHKCIALMNQALQILKSGNYFLLESNCYESIAYSYESLNQFDSAYKYHKYFKRASDSLFNAENIKSLTKIETKFQLSSKQNEIDLLNAKNKNNELIVAKEKMIKWFFAGGIVLLGFILFLVFRQLKIKKSALQLINEQKTVIEEKNKEIVDSINYAKRIQTTLLSTNKDLSSNLKDYFIFYQPKDIVSGDFYWSKVQDDYFYFVVADCTGHGVPGAFMSLLNISKLNEAISEKKLIFPDEIFNYVRSEIAESLASKNEGEAGLKDGMDAVCCMIDKKNNSIYASCANNPIWIIKNNSILEIKADKMPIGESYQHQSFRRIRLDVQPGDQLVLFTDGFADQFGGPKGKKFKYKQLSDFLLSISGKSMPDQKKELHIRFNQWKGQLDQIDDVLIASFKI